MNEPKLYIFSGAGISQESGVPTFRDSGGLWNNHSVDEVCNIETFEDNYNKVHDFYNKRRLELESIKPNSAHEMIAELQQEFGANRVINFTTNVDDLLEQAGCINVRHIHGNIKQLIINYGTDDSESVDIGFTEYDYSKDKKVDGTYSINAKPDVVFFGQHAPMYSELSYISDDIKPNDIVVVVGTSLEVVDFSMLLNGKSCHSIIIDPSINENDRFHDDFNEQNKFTPMYYALPVFDYKVNDKATAGFDKMRDFIENKMRNY